MDISAVNMKNNLQCFKPEILRECATNTKIPLRISSKRDHVLRTGIELYMTISVLPYLQADLQVVGLKLKPNFELPNLVAPYIKILQSEPRGRTNCPHPCLHHN